MHHCHYIKLRLLLAILIGMLSLNNVFASEKVRIYFKFDKSDIEKSYMDNEASLDRLQDILKQTNLSRLDSVVIVSQTSPEGVFEHNMLLSRKRANALKDFIVQYYPQIEPFIKTHIVGEAWNELRELVVKDAKIKESTRQKVLDVIDADINAGTKKWRLERLHIYKYLVLTYFRELRNSTYITFYEKEAPAKPEPEKQQEVVVEEIPVQVDTVKPEPVQEVVQTPEPQIIPKRELFFLRTNLLVPLANIGAELPIGTNWSVALDYYFPWFFREKNNKECTQMLMWNLEGRYWFGKNRTTDDYLEGHSLGLNGMFGYYDIQRNYVGHQGEFVNVSLDYTYGLPIFKDKIHLEFTFGVGYLFSKAEKYEVYQENGKGYRKGYKENIHWVGPNKIGVSVVVPIKAKGRSQK